MIPEIIIIGNALCPTEWPDEIILPDHYNCKIDASLEDLEKMRQTLVFIDEAFLTATILPLMIHALGKIHTG